MPPGASAAGGLSELSACVVGAEVASGVSAVVVGVVPGSVVAESEDSPPPQAAATIAIARITRFFFNSHPILLGLSEQPT